MITLYKYLSYSRIYLILSRFDSSSSPCDYVLHNALFFIFESTFGTPLFSLHLALFNKARKGNATLNCIFNSKGGGGGGGEEVDEDQKQCITKFMISCLIVFSGSAYNTILISDIFLCPLNDPLTKCIPIVQSPQQQQRLRFRDSSTRQQPRRLPSRIRRQGTGDRRDMSRSICCLIRN